MRGAALPPLTAAGQPDSSFYGALTADDRAWLRDRSAVRTFPPGYRLAMEGETSPDVRILLSGWTKATSVTPGGEEVVLRIYGPGDLLGAEAVLTGQSRPETVTALAKCTALLLPARRFTDVLDRNPGIARAFSIALLQRTQAADELVKLRHADADARLARVLLALADRAGAKAADGITIPVELTQEDLASLLGLSRSTVARTLRSLRRQGMIRTGYRNITVTDIRELRRVATS